MLNSVSNKLKIIGLKNGSPHSVIILLAVSQYFRNCSLNFNCIWRTEKNVAANFRNSAAQGIYCTTQKIDHA
ncbi:hypothetical protein D3C73_1514650 [compost metagenome]